LLLTQAGALGPLGFLNNPPGYHLVRPNTPVAPFGAPLATATFVDPTARIHNGDHVIVGQKSFIGPYAALDATVGFIKIGSGSEVLDNAVITATPGGLRGTPSNVLIGDKVSIGFGAVVNGPSTIGAYGKEAAPTGVGPSAGINGANLSPGSIVGALAYVGPGVTVPAGMYVRPGVSVTTQAEATDPALGKVEAIPASVLTDLTTELARGSALANGYTYLYQGQSATGVNPGVDPSVTGVFNGNLAAVSGTSQEPGPASTSAATGINFEPSKTGPKFPGPHVAQVEGNVYFFPTRVTGDARFAARAHTVARRLGKLTSIRADQGQPIQFFGAPVTGRAVTINSPLGGTVTTTSGSTTTTKTVGGLAVGANFQAGDNAVLLGGPGTAYFVGDNVTLGAKSVVSRSVLGPNVTVGPKSYIFNSLVAGNTVIPPGTIMIDSKVVGQVQW